MLWTVKTLSLQLFLPSNATIMKRLCEFI